jgi:hypothetical protein
MEDLKKFDFAHLIDMLVMQTSLYKCLKQQGASQDQLNISRHFLRAIQDEIKAKHQQIHDKIVNDNGTVNLNLDASEQPLI